MPDNHSMDDLKPTISVAGNPGAWVLLGKAHTNEAGKGYGWMKSTKAMQVPGGVLVQATTEHRLDGAVTACAEALTFVPGAALEMTGEHNVCRLVWNQPPTA